MILICYYVHKLLTDGHVLVQDADRAAKLVHSVENHRQYVMEVLMFLQLFCGYDSYMMHVLGTIWSGL